LLRHSERRAAARPVAVGLAVAVSAIKTRSASGDPTMAQVLLIDGDKSRLGHVESMLSTAGHTVLTAHSGGQALELLQQQRVDVVLLDVQVPDISGTDFLHAMREGPLAVPLVAMTSFGDPRVADITIPIGLAEDTERAVADSARPDSVPRMHDSADAISDAAPDLDLYAAHAAARWARVVVAVIDAADDPRTVAGWSRLVYASPGALRNWCRMAGIPPRPSLVFARLLRAVSLSDGGRHKPENLLDIVDRRTLVGLLKFAGFSTEREFPTDLETFLHRQALVRDPDALREVRRTLAERRTTNGHALHRA
jgi:CheY-like chemotaxis protein